MKEEEQKGERMRKEETRGNTTGEERRGDGVKEEERLKHFTLLIPIYGAIKRAIS